jgi:hypothetical protein
MKYLAAVICAFVLYTLFSCKNDNITEFIDEDYSISFPSHLNMNSEVSGAEFVLTTEKTIEEDNFIENINLATQDIGDMDLSTFIESSENQIESIGKIIKSKRVKENRSDYHRMTFTVTQGNIEAKLIQHSFVKNKKAYVLTFSAKSNEFNDYYKEMNTVLLSFNLK